MIYASRDNVSHSYQIKTHVDEYNYGVSYRNRRVTTKWLAYNYLNKYKCIAMMSLVDLKALVKEDVKVDLTLSQVRRAKLLTIIKLEGDLKDEYARL